MIDQRQVSSMRTPLLVAVAGAVTLLLSVTSCSSDDDDNAGAGASSNGSGARSNGSGASNGSNGNPALPNGPPTTGPHYPGSGEGFRPLVPGCGPETANECTGSCEARGGDPGVDVIRPPATLCFSGEGDPTPEDPAVVIEQSVENANGKSYVHLRVTFDPAFVDNTYGTAASSGWGDRGHTWKDLTGSDHTELLLTDGAGETVLNFKIDYISVPGDGGGRPKGGDQTTSVDRCQAATLGVNGGDGEVIQGDAAHVLAASTSLSRNIQGCGLCLNAACEGGDCTVNSPATDDQYTPPAGAEAWDYRQVYEVWIDAAAFGSAGFGQAYVTYVHASPAKAANSTVDVTPSECPPTWDDPYCPPSIVQEGGNCFNYPGTGGSSSGSGGSNSGAGGSGSNGECEPNWQLWVQSEGKSACTPIPYANYPGMAPCPEGYTLDVESEGRYCVPSP